MPNYVIQQGDTLSLLAKRNKLASWETIYNHPNNAAFKRNRPNPNLIYPGDVVYIPAIETRTEEGSTEQTHKFTVRRQKQVLRIAVEDIMGERIADTDYELVVGSLKLNGKTDGEGLLEEEIPVDATKGKLKVGNHKWDLLIGHLNPVTSNTKDKGVSGAQGRLRNLGYTAGPIDGIHGPKTRAAIEAFQADEKLDVNGELNEETREALVRVHHI